MEPDFLRSSLNLSSALMNNPQLNFNQSYKKKDSEFEDVFEDVKSFKSINTHSIGIGGDSNPTKERSTDVINLVHVASSATNTN